jgi:hypothetical protein
MAGPRVTLLDGREHELNGPGLRAWARRISGMHDMPYVCRSYREPFALVAWHRGPVGVDLERLEPLGADFGRSICTPAELDRYAARLHDPELVASLWCSKEALAKALGDALAYDPRRLESPLSWPDAVAGAWRAQPLRGLPAGHVGWVCWRSDSGRESPSGPLAEGELGVVQRIRLDPRPRAAQQVGDEQRAAGLDAAAPGDGEEGRRLHLDGQGTGGAPAGLAVTGVVEQVGGDHWPYAGVRSGRLERPEQRVRGRHASVGPEGPAGSVVGDRLAGDQQVAEAEAGVEPA